MITQSVLKLSPFSERSKGLERCFAYPPPPQKKMFSLFTRAPDLNKLPCASDAKHRILVQPRPLSSLKTIPQLHKHER